MLEFVGMCLKPLGSFEASTGPVDLCSRWQDRCSGTIPSHTKHREDEKKWKLINTTTFRSSSYLS